VEGSRFDAWTRRRVGLAAGSILGSLLALVQPDASEAAKKKKDKKKSCGALGDSCQPSGKKACCKKGGLSCQAPLIGPGGRTCCLPGNKTCKRNKDCCSDQCVDNVCACKSTGQECSNVDFVCCSVNCVETEPGIFTCQPKA
jgi:hypothetical protein